MRIAAYTRVSDASQVERLSLATQARLILDHCARQGWPEPVLFTDAGKSAYNDAIEKRPRLAALIVAVQAREYDTVIVYDFDRLARNAVIQLTIAQQLQRFGCALVSLNQTTDLASPEGKMMYTFNAGINEFYSAQISRKTRAGLAHIRAQGGHVGGLPYGARRDADYRLVLNPATADTLALILRLAATGSYSAASTALNRRGVPTKHGVNAWAAETIRSIVRSGRWLLDQPAPWPARWLAAVNRPRLSRANTTRGINELSGVLRCACGGTIAYGGFAPRRAGAPPRYGIQCRHWTKERPDGLHCGYRKTYATHYEALASAALLALPDLTAVDRTPPDLAAARASLRVRRIDLARAVARGLPDDEADQLQAGLDAEEAALPLDSGTERALATDLRVVQLAWLALDAAERNAIYRRLVTRIVITGRELRVEWVPALRRLLDHLAATRPA